MEVGNDNINTLSSTTKPRNQYKEVLEFLKSWSGETLSLEELRAKGVDSVIRFTIKSWLMNYQLPDDKLLEVPEEELEKYPIKVELLIKKAEEEALKRDLENSNNLYVRYKLLQHGYKPGPLASKADWKDFSMQNRIYTLSYYVMEALKRDAEFITLSSIPKPITFYYRDHRKLNPNEKAYRQFVSELGLEEDEPIEGFTLATLILAKYGYLEESLRGFYEEIVRQLIKPSSMRLPPCIEAIAFKPLFYDLERKKINDEALKVLASWIKYYSKGFTNGRMLREGDSRIALFSYLVRRVYKEIEESWEVIERFKKFYENAKPFKCSMVEELEKKERLKLCNLKCPFSAPLDRIEEALAKIEEVNLYGADYIQIVPPKESGVSPFLEPYGSITPNSKLVQRFAGFLGLLYGEPFMDTVEAMKILLALKERARYVQNYLSPLVMVEEWFREEMEKLLEDGALPWELRAKDRPFLSKDRKLLYVHRDLIQMDLMAGGLEGYTTQKLIRDLKKLPNPPIKGISNMIDVRRDSYSEEKIKARFWVISVKWLEDQGIKVKVQVPTMDLGEAPSQPIAQENPKEKEKLTPMEKLILEMAEEPIELNELADRVAGIFQIDREKVLEVITELMSRGFLKLEEGLKLRRAK